jgi:hypothetical protein
MKKMYVMLCCAFMFNASHALKYIVKEHLTAEEEQNFSNTLQRQVQQLPREIESMLAMNDQDAANKIFFTSGYNNYLIAQARYVTDTTKNDSVFSTHLAQLLELNKKIDSIQDNVQKKMTMLRIPATIENLQRALRSQQRIETMRDALEHSETLLRDVDRLFADHGALDTILSNVKQMKELQRQLRLRINQKVLNLLPGEIASLQRTIRDPHVDRTQLIKRLDHARSLEETIDSIFSDEEKEQTSNAQKIGRLQGLLEQLEKKIATENLDLH